VSVGSSGKDGPRGFDGGWGFSVRHLSLAFTGGSVQTKPKIRIDPMNVRILNILQQDGRATTAEIARRMKRAESTIKERIGLMEKAGVIKGYTAIVDKAALGYTTQALIFCNIPSELIDQVDEKLLEIKNVLRLYHMTGERRCVIKIVTKKNEEVWNLVHRVLIPMGIKDVDSHIVMRVADRNPPETIIEEPVRED